MSRNHVSYIISSHQSIQQLKVDLRLVVIDVDFRFIAGGTTEMQDGLFTNLTFEISPEAIAAQLTRARWE